MLDKLTELKQHYELSLLEASEAIQQEQKYGTIGTIKYWVGKKVAILDIIADLDALILEYSQKGRK